MKIGFAKLLINPRANHAGVNVAVELTGNRRFSKALNIHILGVVSSRFWYSLTQDRLEKP